MASNSKTLRLVARVMAFAFAPSSALAAGKAPNANGSLDEMLLYSRALSAGEIAGLAGNLTTVYPNKVYEKNTTSGVVTTSYYHGGKLMAIRRDGVLEYVHQDHLSGTNLTTNSAGAVLGRVAYLPFGGTRSQSGGLGTDREYTGQRLDGTGQYFYNAYGGCAAWMAMTAFDTRGRCASYSERRR